MLKDHLKQKQLIPFLVAGYPTIKDSEQVASALIEEGVCVLEIGMPFSDPMADGPAIQHASDEALRNGVNLKTVLDMILRLNKRFPRVDIILFTYLNPLMAYGLEKYVQDAKSSGVKATLTVDLPPEEAVDYIQLHKQYELGTVFLASPTTSQDRLKKISHASSEFVYYISRTGVTGEKSNLSNTLESEVSALRKIISGPVAVGFGISTAEQVKKVSQFADAVIIGSAFIRMIRDHSKEGQALVQIRKFAKDCLQILK